MSLTSFRLFFLFILLSWGAGAQALRPVHLLAGASLGSLVERSQQQEYVDRNLQSYFLGTGFDEFVLIAEYGKFIESTGQNALVVDRRVENTMLWGLWSPDLNWSSFLPFLSLGIGQSVEIIDTTLLSTTTRDKGRPQVIGGGAFGVRANMPYLWFSVEVRVLAAERWDPSPTAAFMGRLGLYF